MTLRHIRIFLAVCDNGYSVTRAAQALFLAQPAVSRAVSELEEHYGVQLFDRMGRRLYITEAGRRFQEYAGHIVRLFDDMERGFQNWDELGILRVGASITIGSQLMPAIVREFCTAHAGLDVRVWIKQSEALERAVCAGQLDFALIEGTVHDAGLVSEAFLEDSLVVVRAPDGKYGPGDVMTMEAFLRERMLVREKGSGTREVFEAALSASGVSVTPAWESVSTIALVHAAAQGLGVAVVPARMVTDPLARGLVVPVQVDGLDLKRKFRIVYHKDKFLTRSAQEFMELCRGCGRNMEPGSSGA